MAAPVTGIDIDAVRADTPGSRDRVFLDSAGSSLPPTPVLDEVIGHLRREAEVGGYLAAAERDGDLERGYQVFADLLDCAPDEIAFTDSASRSWLSLMDAVPLTDGDRVLIGEVEYGANAVALLRRAEETGVTVETVPSDESGALSVPALREMLDERVKLVSLVHVPSNGGLVNPVREATDAAHDAGALVLLDACQSVGQLPVRVGELGVDMLSGTGRKWLRGPRGTGFLVARRSVAHRLRPRLIDHIAAPWVAPHAYRLRPDARAFQLYEHDVAGRLGLVTAAEYALRLGVAQIAARVGALADRARQGLAGLPGVLVRDLGRSRCGIVTFTVDGLSPAQVRDTLRGRGVVVTVSPAATSLLDMSARGLTDGVVRASPHYFATEADIDRFVGEVARLSG
ncbi:MAG TPA: aminotransferase class V-fold PLP-dependent enzyme [Pseudonocardiaceae bacterium]|nr:aminotransferase class V-fold PLP-dependent enzyme [Pseudonocardiaceae bacterium]